MNFNLIKLNKVDSTNNYAVKLLKNKILAQQLSFLIFRQEVGVGTGISGFL